MKKLDMKRLQFNIDTIVCDYDHAIVGVDLYYDHMVTVARQIQDRIQLDTGDSFMLISCEDMPQDILNSVFTLETHMTPYLRLDDGLINVRGSRIYKYNNDNIFVPIFKFHSPEDVHYEGAIIIFGRKHTFAKRLIKFTQHCVQVGAEERDKKFIKNTTEHNDVLDKVFLPDGLKENIISDIDDFIKAEKLYREELGIPWKRGLVLHGPPGNGKTLLVRCIKEYFGLNTSNIVDCINGDGELDLPETELEAERVTFTVSNILRHIYPEQRLPQLYYIEDIDKFVASQSNDSPKIALTSILQAIDGVQTLDGVLLIATTNYINDVAEALIARPGRFDSIYEIKSPTDKQIKSLLQYHNFKVADSSLDFIADSLKGSSMAFVEELIKSAKSRFKRSEFKRTEIQVILDRLKIHQKRYRDTWSKVGF